MSAELFKLVSNRGRANQAPTPLVELGPPGPAPRHHAPFAIDSNNLPINQREFYPTWPRLADVYVGDAAQRLEQRMKCSLNETDKLLGRVVNSSTFDEYVRDLQREGAGVARGPDSGWEPPDPVADYQIPVYDGGLGFSTVSRLLRVTSLSRRGHRGDSDPSPPEGSEGEKGSEGAKKAAAPPAGGRRSRRKRLAAGLPVGPPASRPAPRGAEKAEDVDDMDPSFFEPPASPVTKPSGAANQPDQQLSRAALDALDAQKRAPWTQKEVPAVASSSGFSTRLGSSVISLASGKPAVPGRASAIPSRAQPDVISVGDSDGEPPAGRGAFALPPRAPRAPSASGADAVKSDSTMQELDHDPSSADSDEDALWARVKMDSTAVHYSPMLEDVWTALASRGLEAGPSGPSYGVRRPRDADYVRTFLLMRSALCTVCLKYGCTVHNLPEKALITPASDPRYRKAQDASPPRIPNLPRRGGRTIEWASLQGPGGVELTGKTAVRALLDPHREKVYPIPRFRHETHASGEELRYPSSIIPSKRLSPRALPERAAAARMGVTHSSLLGCPPHGPLPPADPLFFVSEPSDIDSFPLETRRDLRRRHRVERLTWPQLMRATPASYDPAPFMKSDLGQANYSLRLEEALLERQVQPVFYSDLLLDYRRRHILRKPVPGAFKYHLPRQYRVIGGARAREGQREAKSADSEPAEAAQLVSAHSPVQAADPAVRNASSRSGPTSLLLPSSQIISISSTSVSDNADAPEVQSVSHAFSVPSASSSSVEVLSDSLDANGGGSRAPGPGHGGFRGGHGGFEPRRVRSSRPSRSSRTVGLSETLSGSSRSSYSADSADESSGSTASRSAGSSSTVSHPDDDTANDPVSGESASEGPHNLSERAHSSSAGSPGAARKACPSAVAFLADHVHLLSQFRLSRKRRALVTLFLKIYDGNLPVVASLCGLPVPAVLVVGLVDGSIPKNVPSFFRRAGGGQPWTDPFPGPPVYSRRYLSIVRGERYQAWIAQEHAEEVAEAKLERKHERAADRPCKLTHANCCRGQCLTHFPPHWFIDFASRLKYPRPLDVGACTQVFWTLMRRGTGDLVAPGGIVAPGRERGQELDLRLARILEERVIRQVAASHVRFVFPLFLVALRELHARARTLGQPCLREMMPVVSETRAAQVGVWQAREPALAVRDRARFPGGCYHPGFPCDIHVCTCVQNNLSCGEHCSCYGPQSHCRNMVLGCGAAGGAGREIPWLETVPAKRLGGIGRRAAENVERGSKKARRMAKSAKETDREADAAVGGKTPDSPSWSPAARRAELVQAAEKPTELQRIQGAQEAQATQGTLSAPLSPSAHQDRKGQEARGPWPLERSAQKPSPAEAATESIATSSDVTVSSVNTGTAASLAGGAGNKCQTGTKLSPGASAAATPAAGVILPTGKARRPCECMRSHHLCSGGACECMQVQAALLRRPPEVALRRFCICPYSLLAVKLCNAAKPILVRSYTHGYGLRAVGLQRMQGMIYPILEYTGELTTACESERRGRLSDLLKLTYLFGLRPANMGYEPYPDIDARTRGNLARYANHSPNASLLVETFSVMSEKICVFLRPPHGISPSEELTINYHFNKQQERMYGFF